MSSKKPTIETIAVLTAVAVFFLVLFGDSYLKASDPVYLQTTTSNSGRLVRVVNETPRALYCFITYSGGYNYFDFFVDANSVSRWYFEPVGYYEWRCQ